MAELDIRARFQLPKEQLIPGSAFRYMTDSAAWRVLVVEDEVLIRISAVAALEAAGFAVFEAEDGASALKLIRGGLKLDALFTDVNMPGSPDGLGLALEACSWLPNLRVLITSGRPAPVPPLPGNGRFLAKPYDPDGIGTRLFETPPAV